MIGVRMGLQREYPQVEAGMMLAYLGQNLYLGVESPDVGDVPRPG